MRPGKDVSAQRRNVHRDVRFLRGIVDVLLRTGDWSGHTEGDVHALKLWLGINGIPPGLTITYVLVVDPRGMQGCILA